MNKLFSLVLLAGLSLQVQAEQVTQRIPYFSNDQVDAWHTVIYPSAKQILKPHRHDNNRVIVAFTDGVLKITNDKGDVHFLKLAKQQAYFLKKDVAGETHTDENVSGHIIKLAVIEIR